MSRLLSFISKHKKVCDLNKVYTLDEFNYFIKTNPVQLYEQMINEVKTFKICLYYDVNNTELLISQDNAAKHINYKTYVNLAFVVEIHSIDIPNQYKRLRKGKLCIEPLKNYVYIDGIKKEEPRIEKFIKNREICDKRKTLSFSTTLDDASVGFTYYWIFTDKSYISSALGIKYKLDILSVYQYFGQIKNNTYEVLMRDSDYDRVTINSYDLEKCLPIVFSELLNKITNLNIHFDTRDYAIGYALRNGEYSKCNWKFGNNLLEQSNLLDDDKATDTEMTSLVYKNV